MFENKYIPEWDCHYSRIIESWHKACYRKRIFKSGLSFRTWLKEITFCGYKLTEDQICEIMVMYGNGKMELELLAEDFLEKHP